MQRISPLLRLTLRTTLTTARPVPRLTTARLVSLNSHPFSTQLPGGTRDAAAHNNNDDDAFKNGHMVAYDEMKKITIAPDDSILIIDVREPDEVALGSIPSSVNVPLSSFEKSLSMDEGDFTRVHGFHKPAKSQNIIFYCRSGKRSTTAIDLAKRAGFRAVRNYEGSWLDWQAKDAKNDD